MPDINPLISANLRNIGTSADFVSPDELQLRPRIPIDILPFPRPQPIPVPPTPPAPPTVIPAPPPTPAPPVIPVAPADNPFDKLPLPSPGDRIKSDDVKHVSQALQIVAKMSAVSGSLFGRTFGDAKLSLVGQGYQIARVMSVFGAEIDNLGDLSLDSRKVIQVLPVVLGEPQVTVVVTEAVDTRRFVPNLLGLTYGDAQERIKSLVGDVPLSGPPPGAPQLVGLTLDQAQQALQH